MDISSVQTVDKVERQRSTVIFLQKRQEDQKLEAKKKGRKKSRSTGMTIRREEAERQPEWRARQIRTAGSSAVTGSRMDFITVNTDHLYWKTTTREGYRQYFCDSKICKSCPKRNECFGASTTRRMVTRHVWQDDLDAITYFTRKTAIGRRIYEWRKETIERSFAEAKVNHGLRFARMCGIQNMREQSFLNAAVQNMKRLAKAFSIFVYILKARVFRKTRALSLI